MSGVPYLKIGTWEFYEMHIKFKHLGPLVMWNCQNSWKWKWPLFRTVLAFFFARRNRNGRPHRSGLHSSKKWSLSFQWVLTIPHDKATKMLEFDVNLIKFSGANFEMWHPWRLFLCKMAPLTLFLVQNWCFVKSSLNKVNLWETSISTAVYLAIFSVKNPFF